MSDVDTDKLIQGTEQSDLSAPRPDQSNAPMPQRSKVSIWWQAVRPVSFTATLSPFLVGIGIAALQGVFEPGWVLLTVLGAVLLQAGTNLINDYFDYRSGADSSASLSPSRVIQQRLLLPEQVYGGGLVCFVLAGLLGIPLALHGGVVIWYLGMLGLLIGYFYTGGKRSLAYMGLGELGVFLAMGPAIVLGTYAVQTQQFSWLAVIAGVPVGLFVTAVLQANNLRDIETDRAHAKLTLAARFGRGFARHEYAFLLLGAFVTTPLLALFDPRLIWAGLPVLLTAPIAIQLVREAYETEDMRRLNMLLRRTGKLHGLFGLALASGLIALAIAV